MGKIQLQKFEIFLNANKKVYQLGEEVVGKCVIALEGELQLNMIRMQLVGMAEVKWTENKGSGNHRRARTYKDSIQYMALDYDFVRNTFNGMITKGIHEFPFCYQLPKEGIPSSFVGFHGSVKYWIEAEIEKPLFSFNHKTKTEFEVEAPLICENLMVPMSATRERKLGFLWLKPGVITIDINVDKRGYIPGELIAVNSNIANKTSLRVTPRATLRQTQTFIAKGKQKTKETKYLRVEGTPVDPGLTSVEIIQVPVPANVQLSVDCPIISVTYELHVTVDIPSAMNTHIDLPLVITKECVLTKSSAYSVRKQSNGDMLYVQI